uniref:Uncharacterized protein n=1 Tax=Triticum urartu TaxID=4572 RepID=A0A8R7Q155_TRIUA
MPYYFSDSTMSPLPVPAVVEQAPAGAAAGISASFPAKGGFGTQHAPNPTSRYFRHVVHCKGCRDSVSRYTAVKKPFVVLAAVAAAADVLAA